jgi:hypothetical protein
LAGSRFRREGRKETAPRVLSRARVPKLRFLTDLLNFHRISDPREPIGRLARHNCVQDIIVGSEALAAGFVARQTLRTKYVKLHHNVYARAVPHKAGSSCGSARVSCTTSRRQSCDGYVTR